MDNIKVTVPTDDQASNLYSGSSSQIMFIPFEENKHLTLGKGDILTQYKSGNSNNKKISKIIKWGQLKLLISEVEFLGLYYDPAIHKNPKFVYVGAGNRGTHIAVLARMFPEIKFVLYDKENFNPILKNEPNIEIRFRYFEKKDVDEWRAYREKGNTLFFITDIRNRAYKVVTNADERRQDFWETDSLLKKDQEMQMSWVNEIKPTKTMLKFRAPYYEKFLPEEMHKYSYFNGTLYRQAFQGQSSSEMRLVPDDDLSVMDWDIRVYENAVFEHNSNTRNSIFINPLDGSKAPIYVEIGLLNDYDSTLFTYVMKKYLDRVYPTYTIPQLKEFMKQVMESANNRATNLKGLREGVKRSEEDLAEEEEDG